MQELDKDYRMVEIVIASLEVLIHHSCPLCRVDFVRPEWTLLRTPVRIARTSKEKCNLRGGRLTALKRVSPDLETSAQKVNSLKFLHVAR